MDAARSPQLPDSQDPTILRCVVARPVARGSRVDVLWELSGDNPLQPRHQFHLTYPGLRVESFAPQLWMEIFLALQLRLFARLARPVAVKLPIPLPGPVVAFWRAFHQADLVEIGPVDTTDGYLPIARQAAGQSPRRRNALFYGGGKDSLLGALLLADVEGKDNLLLINFAAPPPGAHYESKAAEFREATILDPARRRLGVATEQVVTDYQMTLRPGADGVLPHVELYTAGALPWLIHYGIRHAFFTYGRNAYRITRQAGSAPIWSFASSRRNMLDAQSAHYRQRLGLELDIANAGDLLTNFSSYAVLSERYPAATDLVVSCGNARPGALACGHCAKCLVGAFLALACGRPPQIIDIEAVLTSSPRVHQAVAAARSPRTTPPGANRPYCSSLTSRPDFPNLLRAIAFADPTLLQPHAAAAEANLATIATAWGNDPRPDTMALSRTSIAGLRLPVLQRIASILASHLPLVDAIRGPFGVDGLADDHGIDEVMPLPPHLAALAATHPAG